MMSLNRGKKVSGLV